MLSQISWRICNTMMTTPVSILFFVSHYLVTATFGKIELDFVNLRTEAYSEDSRVPQMSLGTPSEDAFRRDLTINALFYNIHTQLVEDFTGQGLADLRRAIIRTPLPSMVTLQDDPLRALRVLRFACRFNFSIAEETGACLRAQLLLCCSFVCDGHLSLLYDRILS